jgi:hypothetical protein
LFFASGETEVDPAGFLTEDAVECWGHRRTGDFAVLPPEGAAGDHREDAIGGFVFDPVFDLLSHPLRGGGVFGEEEHEPGGVIECLGDA